MNRINRKVEYALMALKHMSQKRPGELTSAKEIADHLRIPFDATARVLQVMTNRQVLRSEQGVQGGYQITKDLGKVSLMELVEMIEGPVAVARCAHLGESEDACRVQGTCNITAPISYLNGRINEFYRGLSIKQILFVGPAGLGSRAEAAHG